MSHARVPSRSRALPLILALAVPLALPVSVGVLGERTCSAEPMIATDPSAPTSDFDPGSLSHPRWLPFGILDRMQLAPFRASVTDEIGTGDSGGTSSLTLHAQMSTACDCHIGAYGTLPVSILVDDSPDAMLTANMPAGGSAGTSFGGMPSPSAARTVLGTADVGLFGAADVTPQAETIFRVGALLPTGSRHPHRWLQSARAGDAVLELPRSAGIRLSVSKISGWEPLSRGLPARWRQHLDSGAPIVRATRFDLGIDVAEVLVGNTNPVHVVPRAGVGILIARTRTTLSADTALSLDPFVDGGGAHLRWSAGLTGRLAHLDGGGWFLQPALTAAVVHSDLGWSANLLFDLAATARPSRGGYD